MQSKCSKMLKLLFLSSLLLNSLSFAKSLGVEGAVFPVAEVSFLDFIATRLNELEKRGELNKMQERWQELAAKKANRPTPINLPRARVSTTHLYVPETILSQDIYDATGRVLYRQGTKVNALDYLPTYTPCWLFFDGDDLAQVAWAQKALKSCLAPTLILTGGAVFDAETTFDSAIYFDQAGKMTSLLKINNLPALVERQNSSLLIKEFCIKESGDVC